MKTKDFLVEYEGIGEDANAMHMENEVQKARADCYNAAKSAIALHKMLKDVDPATGIDPWVVEKLTLATDYLKTVNEYFESETMGDEEFNLLEPDFEAEFSQHLPELPAPNRMSDMSDPTSVLLPESRQKLKEDLWKAKTLMFFKQGKKYQSPDPKVQPQVDAFYNRLSQMPPEQVKKMGGSLPGNFNLSTVTENEELYATMKPADVARDIGKRMLDVNRMYAQAVAGKDRLVANAAAQKLTQLAAQKRKYEQLAAQQAQQQPGNIRGMTAKTMPKVSESKDYRKGASSKAQQRGWQAAMMQSKKAQKIVKPTNPYDPNSQSEEYADYDAGSKGARRKMRRLGFFTHVEVDERADTFSPDSDFVPQNRGTRPAPQQAAPRKDPNDLDFTEGVRCSTRRFKKKVKEDASAGASSSGSVASVVAPLGARKKPVMQKRVKEEAKEPQKQSAQEKPKQKTQDDSISRTTFKDGKPQEDKIQRTTFKRNEESNTQSEKKDSAPPLAKKQNTGDSIADKTMNTAELNRPGSDRNKWFDSKKNESGAEAGKTKQEPQSSNAPTGNADSYESGKVKETGQPGVPVVSNKFNNSLKTAAVKSETGKGVY